MVMLSGLCLVFVGFFALSESHPVHSHFGKKMYFPMKGFGKGAGKGGPGRFKQLNYFRNIIVPQKVIKKIPVFKEVRTFKKVPVYRRVYVDRPVYVPIIREVQPNHNSGAWFPKNVPSPDVMPVARQGPATRVDRKPVPGVDFVQDVNNFAPEVNNFAPEINNFGPEVNNFGPDLNNFGPDLNNFGPDLNNFGPDLGGIGMEFNFGPDLGLNGGGGFVDPLPAQPQPRGETIVTSNIQITDADTVVSNTNTASSQSQSANFNMNAHMNANLHDADTVSIGPGGPRAVTGAAEANLLNGLDGLGGLVDVGMLGGGPAAALDMGALAGAQQAGMGPMDHGHGHGSVGGGGAGGFTDLLGGFGPVDQLATGAVHNGQAGTMVGEPVAIVSIDGHLGGASGHGGQTGQSHMSHDVGMTSAGGHAGHI